MAINQTEKSIMQINLLVNEISCLARVLENSGKFTESPYYYDKLGSRENIECVMALAADVLQKIVEQMSVQMLEELYNDHRISLPEYVDMMKEAIRTMNCQEIQNCAQMFAHFVCDLVICEAQSDEHYKKIFKGNKNRKRNIDVVREIRKEILNFKLLVEDIEMTLCSEEWTLVDMYEHSDIHLARIVAVVEKVVQLLNELTEDFKDTLDYEVDDCGGFDCESFAWCLSKVKHEGFEIVNYLESFENALRNLDQELAIIEKWFKLFTQPSYLEEAGNL